MPHWYNHQKDSSPAKGRNPNEPFSEVELLATDREYKKTVVKYCKTTTDMTAMEIAEKIESSISLVTTLWKEIRDEEQFKLEEKADEQIRKHIREYEFIKIELFQAWQDSKKPYEKERYEAGVTTKGEIDKTTTDKIPRLADVSYLQEIRMINAEIAKLLGIVKMAEINFNQQNNSFNVAASEAPPLVPAEHDQFIKKPDALPAGSRVTSIEEDLDDIEEAEYEEDD